MKNHFSRMHKDSYKQVLEAISEVLQAWDPYSLIQEGAPRDEFDGEAVLIASKVKDFNSIEETMVVISNVFSSRFEPQVFLPENCFIPAQEIYMRLRKRNLLPAA